MTRNANIVLSALLAASPLGWAYPNGLARADDATQQAASPALRYSGRLDAVGSERSCAGQNDCYQAAARGGDSGFLRARASLDRDSGLLSIDLLYETDNLIRGGKGKAVVVGRDVEGRERFRVVTSELGRKGKAPGRAVKTGRIRADNITTPIDPAIAGQIVRLEIEAQHTGSIAGNEGLGTLLALAKVVAEVIAIIP